MKPLAAAAALILLSAGHVFADPTPRYEVVPLHSLPGTETEDTAFCLPRALNNEGECAGSVGFNTRFRAVRWDADGNIHLLSTSSRRLDGAEGINDCGQVIAYATTSRTNSKTDRAARLYVVNKTGTARLLTPPAGTKAMGFDGGEAINNAGQTVFNVQTGTGFPFRAVLSDHRMLKDLGYLPLRADPAQLEAHNAYTHVYALNGSGMAAGGSETYVQGMNAVLTHAFLWQEGTMTDLGILPGYDNFSATALNTQGDVVGGMYTPAEFEADNPSGFSEEHGFLWRNGVMTDLGALPGCRYTVPTGINDKGQIVGNSYNIVKNGGFFLSGGALKSGVFLWQNGKMTDLQTLVPVDWRLQSAVGINSRGDILCTGSHDGMPSRTLGSGAFLLRRLSAMPP